MSKPGDYLIDALRKHAEGEISKRIANVETYRLNPAGIGEHSDMIETIEKELDVIARFDDIISVVDKYFDDPDKKKLTLHE
jgi:hypothetical protein